MEEYIVNFRKIERFSDGRVRMSPIHTSRYNDEMMVRFKSDLKSFGYKFVGRSKDEHGKCSKLYRNRALRTFRYKRRISRTNKRKYF